MKEELMYYHHQMTREISTIAREYQQMEVSQLQQQVMKKVIIKCRNCSITEMISSQENKVLSKLLNLKVQDLIVLAVERVDMVDI